jgi:CRP-like cAMP-binding protein
MRADTRRIGSIERLLHFKKIPTLGMLSAQDLSALSEQAQERFFPEGSQLLREGEPVHAVYFVVEGKVRLRRNGMLLGEVGPGSGVGALAVLARDDQGLDAVALADTMTLELESDALLEVLEDNFSILRHLLREISRRLIDTASQVRRVDPVVLAPPAGRDLDLVERIIFLRQAAPFRRASINALAELARGMTELQFQQGVTLWEEGEPARILYMIVSGQVACTSPTRGLEFSLGPGTPVGAVESVADVPRWYRAVTATPLVALSGDVDGLFDVIEDNFEMGLDYLSVMSQWLISLLQRKAETGASGVGPFQDVEQTEPA